MLSFSMGMRKLRAPKVYTACFLKKLGIIVEEDIVDAVLIIFTNGKILKELNHTIIALIPKIIANRIKESLKILVSPNQSAFVPGRSISNNILLTQELMHNYHLDRGPSRCAFKVDIQKAYDTVDWGFLREVLIGFGFHDRMVKWIMECVTTTSFSISINGSLHGYFKEILGLRSRESVYCSKFDLVNLCFADDLFLFAHGDVDSVKVIKEALEEFKNASGLIPSLPKSTAYFCNVLNHVKDCKELIKKVESRVRDWKNKSLSAAGRLQLAQSVLGSMHIYWASVFILPTRVLHDIE
ncbi:hypothetical protein Tco_0681712 [Tanacetum coccineum]|uniref:Reverse transcriptase domain-containing protein n=1 Tax=Tanacetum coccineum TaxID=301880 RepID=A0ABQ4XQE1_9ASTR